MFKTWKRFNNWYYNSNPNIGFNARPTSCFARAHFDKETNPIVRTFCDGVHKGKADQKQKLFNRPTLIHVLETYCFKIVVHPISHTPAPWHMAFSVIFNGFLLQVFSHPNCVIMHFIFTRVQLAPRKLTSRKKM